MYATRAKNTQLSWLYTARGIDKGKRGLAKRDELHFPSFFLFPPSPSPIPFVHGKIVELGLPAITMTIVRDIPAATCVRMGMHMHERALLCSTIRHTR